MGMNWTQVVAPGLHELAHLHAGEYREPCFRTVAAIRFQAVEEQAGGKKALVITYLLY